MPHLILVIRSDRSTADSSKAALVHLARILVIERGIRVNAVAPPLLDTPASRATFADEAMAHTVAPEAIASRFAFLFQSSSAPGDSPVRETLVREITGTR